MSVRVSVLIVGEKNMGDKNKINEQIKHDTKAGIVLSESLAGQPSLRTRSACKAAITSSVLLVSNTFIHPSPVAAV